MTFTTKMTIFLYLFTVYVVGYGITGTSLH